MSALLRRFLSLAAAMLLGGCGGGQALAPLATPDVRPTGPLTDLAPCGAAPAPGGHEPVAGLVLPPQAIVTEVTPLDPTTSVLGYLPLTPSQTRRTYLDREDVRVLTQEDETYDAELLLTTGTHRMYLKILAVCAQGSRFSAVVADEASAQGLPTVPPASPVP